MEKKSSFFIKYFPVIDLEPVKSMNRLFTRSMHETLNRLFAQATSPAVVAYPGNGLLAHLKRKQPSPLPYPAVI